MIRIVTLLGVACVVGGFVLIATGTELVGATLLIAGLMIEAAMGIRAAALKIRDTVSDARSFISGESTTRAWSRSASRAAGSTRKATVVLELEGGEGEVRRIDRELPIPFFYAWGYRLGKRSKLPFLSSLDLSETLAFELRREGSRVDVSRVVAGAE